ncbi:hypothetical protein POTOM_019844 [Populus tomentosa]|uniref:N-acetyltransferase domain-containing protein n=1 Tax=Populus tomentosa TaxID=118781 RepID=A0A8X7ZSM9_POPTO|nr:hypothetical protein POTOM_019844 [Populus tomentosa]
MYCYWHSSIASPFTSFAPSFASSLLTPLEVASHIQETTRFKEDDDYSTIQLQRSSPLRLRQFRPPHRNCKKPPFFLLFNMSFYMTYLARWPDYFHVAEGPGNKVMGYIMGKVEGQGESWHGHVTAVTVASEYRRQQLAKKLMNLLEEISDKIDKAYFVDLFVRASNTPAIKMYEKLGYVIYRRVLRYYSGEEDGLDMRKALSRDVGKKSIIPLKRPVTPDELEYD